MSGKFDEKIFTVTIRRIPATQRLANETWCNQHGERDRDGDLPAFIIYHENGLLDQEWWRDGMRHREGAPAIIYSGQSKDDHPTLEAFYLHGMLHRDGDEPAETWRTPDGRILKLSYAQNGELHRISGPALIERSRKTGRILKKEYWQHGCRIMPPSIAPSMPFPT